MRLVSFFALATALILAPAARADELGGSGFDVPQQQTEWLWGIEGLVRTPLDISANIGGTWAGYVAKSELTFFDGGGAQSRSKHIDLREVGHADAFQGGMRFVGGLGYWSCCVLVEPAVAFWASSPSRDRSVEGPATPEPFGGDNLVSAETRLQRNLDVGFGPQLTWTIPDDTPVLGTQLHMGGLPLVFFPFLGFSQAKYEVELTGYDTLPGVTVLGGGDRDFTDHLFMVGFDLDIPLPGAVGPFTHALTFGFKWVDSDERQGLSFAVTDPGESQRYDFEDNVGYRLELRYQVTWNDFEGFFKRNIFGPVN